MGPSGPWRETGAIVGTTPAARATAAPQPEAEIDPGDGLVVGPDGSLYIPEYWTNRIRRVGLDGIITTVVGIGTPGGHGAFSGDGGPALLAELYFPYGPAFAPDGSLFFVDYGNNRIRRVGPDGIITTVAGNGARGFGGDGGPAGLAQFDRPNALAVGPDGGIYVADTYNNRIRRVGPDGIITTVAGSGAYPTSKEEGEGGPATAAPIGQPYGIGFGPDGSMYVTGRIHVVRKIAPPVPSRLVGEALVASEDGTEIYAFNGSGRHLRTLDAVTGAVRFQFSYDGAGLLTGVTDGDGSVTTVERSAEGIPQAIVAPSGARTALALNPEAYLSSVTDPTGAVHALGYGDGGLLASLSDPRSFVHTFTHDALGLLTEDADPADGSLSLVRSEFEGGYAVAVTTAENRTTTYRVEELATGDERRTRTAPGGSQTQVLLRTDDTRRITLPDGITADFSGQPDPRFGMQSPLPETLVVTTPGGLSSTLTASRSLTYSDPADLLSIGTMTDTVTVNGRAYQTVFDGAEKRFTETSPEGRAGTVRVDDHGRIVERQIATGALLPVTFQYNSSGLLERIQQGDQFWTYAYDSRMRVNSRTDAAGQVVHYAHDDADRLTGTTLPSGRTYAFAYDPSGNRTQVVMPSGAAHGFSYNAVDLPAGYDPPGGAPYARNYDRDRGLAQITLPGGRTISRTYDASGRLSREEFPEGAVDFAYVGAGCCGEEARVAAMSRAPAGGGTGQSIAYAYDGPFVTQETWSGAANATHRYRYNNDFFLVGTTFDAEPETGFSWDKDGRVTTYGPFTLARGGPGGATSELGDGTLNLTLAYDPLGRIVERVHRVDGTRCTGCT